MLESKAFEEYYLAQGIVEPEEWQDFMVSLKSVVRYEKIREDAVLCIITR